MPIKKKNTNYTRRCDFGKTRFLLLVFWCMLWLHIHFAYRSETFQAGKLKVALLFAVHTHSFIQSNIHATCHIWTIDPRSKTSKESIWFQLQEKIPLNVKSSNFSLSNGACRCNVTIGTSNTCSSDEHPSGCLKIIPKLLIQDAILLPIACHGILKLHDLVLIYFHLIFW